MATSILNNVSHKKVKSRNYENFENFQKNFELSERNFNTIHLNIRSLKKYWLELLVYLDPILPCLDVITITEIKISEDETPCFQIKDFNQFSRCRYSGNGGGILVFIRDNYIVNKLFCEMTYAEHLCLQIEDMFSPFSIILSNIYRPPHKNKSRFIEELDIFLSSSNVRNKCILVLGDVNIDTKSKTNDTNSYVNTLYSNGLHNVITDFTREEVSDGHLTTTCIDHINAKVKEWHSIKSFIIKTKLADHYFIGCSLRKSNDTSELSILKNKDR
uniref:Endonuclease/exonuclease/phosphatase domain-containing protein n=1 Tax=Cacopsylla melanoneura TaxID=428564 RepID=A0A8D9DWK1_9HEMI